ncbi:hypothetical protein KIH41_13810 [Litoribacter ruber]|uniref:Uncharacterized protein n=1 Tax=Litoribacter ruber TaxID=702568 RepID=A0AAP2CFN0_9BACT|nr:MULTISPECIES: hypothetical protein [Litoribacter]MBS9522850.1 hypothetical protein [Litoribacter alkaliphilus]MBT0812357.1 hypothetical protein [Litoribacter ruber]
MNKFQLFIHHFFRFIWNAIFVISYPVLASFGLLFIGVTYMFSGLSRVLTKFKKGEKMEITFDKAEWKKMVQDNSLIEGKVCTQIMFGPSGYHFRRSDGVPSVLEDYVFGNKIKVLEEGLLLEKWNSTDSKDLPDFDICLYDPDEDSLKSLTNIKCFDWHLAEQDDNSLNFKWFDGTQGGEVKIAL